MVKRSSSKRAYKKRRTVRKSRVIRRRKTVRSKTQRGGMKSLKEIREDAERIANGLKDKFSNTRTRFEDQFGSSGRNESASPVLMPGTLAADDVGLSEQQSSPAPLQQTDEERKVALKAARTAARVAWTDAQNKSSIAAKAAKAAAEALDNMKLPAGDAKSSVHQAYQALVQKKKDTKAASEAASEAARTAGETSSLAENAAIEGGVTD